MLQTGKRTVQFPQQKQTLTALYMGVWQLELWVNQTWCFRPLKSQKSSRKIQLAAKGENLESSDLLFNNRRTFYILQNNRICNVAQVYEGGKSFP